MKTPLNKYYVLLLLVIMFVAPGVAAYVFYQHPSWLGATKVNKGSLLNPPVKLNVLDNKKKWLIIFWTPKACDAVCLKQLEVLAKVRLALGRKLYHVDQWLIFGDKALPPSLEMKSILKELDFHTVQLSPVEMNAQGSLFADAKIFLADPNNYLILSYPSLAKPDDVYKDLKLLLRITEKNG